MTVDLKTEEGLSHGQYTHTRNEIRDVQYTAALQSITDTLYVRFLIECPVVVC